MFWSMDGQVQILIGDKNFLIVFFCFSTCLLSFFKVIWRFSFCFIQHGRLPIVFLLTRNPIRQVQISISLTKTFWFFENRFYFRILRLLNEDKLASHVHTMLVM